MALNPVINYDELIAFAQKLVQTPSESKQEAEIARIIAERMQELDFDEVMVDPINNVVGRIKGSGGGKSIMFNGHIDHAEPGTMEEPYSGKIMSGAKWDEDGDVLYGRAAVDMKSAVACMVYAAAAIKKAAKESGEQLAGDILVACNPMEEESAAEGVLYMLDKDGITADTSVCGEATNCQVYLGHRGNAEVRIRVQGKMAHGSNPSNGINAAIKASELVCYIMKHYNLPKNEVLGDCTKTILDIDVETTRMAPVVPDVANIYLDRRFLPGETKEQIIKEVEDVIEQAKEEIEDLSTTVSITKWGVAMYTEPEEEIVAAISKAREEVMGEPAAPSAWIFGTDAAFVAERGIKTVGFGPGNEIYAHTPDDHIPLSHLKIAADVYAKTALIVCK